MSEVPGTREAVRRLFWRLWRYKGRLLLTVLFATIISVLFTGSIFALKPVGDLLFDDEGLDKLKASQAMDWPGVRWAVDNHLAPLLVDKQRALLLFVGLIVVMGVTKNVLRYAQEYLAGWVSERVVIDLTNDLYAHVQQLPPSQFTTAGTQVLISRFVNDATLVGNGLAKLFNRMVREPLKALGALAIVLTINARLAFVALVVFPIVGILLVQFGRRIKRWVKAILARRAEILGSLAENFHGIAIIQAYQLEGHFEGKFRARNEELFKEARRKVRLDATTSPVLEVFVHLIGAGVVLYTGTMVIEGEMEPGSFFAFYAAVAAMFDPIGKLGGMTNRLYSAAAAAGRVFAVLDQPPAIRDAPDARPLPPLETEIRFEGVGFHYPGADERAFALRDIDLTIRRGELIGIVGETGHGKSTLVSLLPRFADPTSGRITIDGQDIRTARLADLRAQIGLVTQEHMLWDDTIAANIRHGRLDATDEQVEQAAKAAQIHDWIAAQPLGYQTMVGEHGSALSGGQRQRLALARAIIANPRILILDEATNSLDPQVEAAVQRALDEFVADRTTLVIAHRLSTLHGADRIIVVHDGRIEAVGTHEELMAQSARYPELYRTAMQGRQA